MLLCIPMLADMSIGRCSFSGSQPPHSMSIGSTVVYYHEMSSSSRNVGGTEYKQCYGDVWVIYGNSSDAQRLKFETSSGTVQVCYNY